MATSSNWPSNFGTPLPRPPKKAQPPKRHLWQDLLILLVEARKTMPRTKFPPPSKSKPEQKEISDNRKKRSTHGSRATPLKPPNATGTHSNYFIVNSPTMNSSMFKNCSGSTMRHAAISFNGSLEKKPKNFSIVLIRISAIQQDKKFK